MAWWYYLILAVLTVAVYKGNKPQQQSVLPTEDLELPTAEAGKKIPVLFGTRDIKSPNLVWYGNFRSTAIRKKGGKK